MNFSKSCLDLESLERQCRICPLCAFHFWHSSVILVILREDLFWAHWIWRRYWLEWEKGDARKLERKPSGITLEWRYQLMKFMWLQNLVLVKIKQLRSNFFPRCLLPLCVFSVPDSRFLLPILVTSIWDCIAFTCLVLLLVQKAFFFLLTSHLQNWNQSRLGHATRLFAHREVVLHSLIGSCDTHLFSDWLWCNPGFVKTRLTQNILSDSKLMCVKVISRTLSLVAWHLYRMSAEKQRPDFLFSK